MRKRGRLSYKGGDFNAELPLTPLRSPEEGTGRHGAAPKHHTHLLHGLCHTKSFVRLGTPCKLVRLCCAHERPVGRPLERHNGEAKVVPVDDEARAPIHLGKPTHDQAWDSRRILHGESSASKGNRKSNSRNREDIVDFAKRESNTATGKDRLKRILQEMCFEAGHISRLDIPGISCRRKEELSPLPIFLPHRLKSQSWF